MVDARFLLAPCLAALLAAGCGSTPEAAPPPPEDVIAPLSSESKASPLLDQARDLARSRDYLPASELFALLANTDPDTSTRAELQYRAGECAFLGGDYAEAYDLYSELLKEYPLTPHLTKVVERVFTIARLFAEGVAEKPSVLLGMELSDREFGIKILTEFQKARERHPLADDALYHKTLALDDMGEHEEAILTARKLLREYPDTALAETLDFRIGLILLETSDGAEYDKGPIEGALAHLRSYLRRYPNGDHVEEARRRVQETEELLAQHMLEVAHYYLRQDEEYSATIYLLAIARDFPATEAAKEATAIHRTLPARSPPPPKPDPAGLEGPPKANVDRYRIPPPSAGQPKPSD